MKRLFIIMMVLLGATMAFAAEKDKAKEAILVVQYGSSIDETRAKTIDLIFDEVKAANPQMEVREAYMAAPVRRKLDKRGIHKDSPVDALLRLHVDGYTKVYVQPTLISDGIEMNELREAVRKVETLFDGIKVGTPLLYDLEDFKMILPVLFGEPAAKGTSVVWVGHGNNLHSTGTYSMLDMMLQTRNKQYHMTTIEGYPDRGLTVGQLTAAKVKKAVLVPFLLVCGDHTLNDISKEIKPVLESSGIQTTVVLKGFAERPEVRQMYVQKVADLVK